MTTENGTGLETVEQVNTPAPAQRQVLRVEDDSALSYLFDTARFEHMQRIATAMAGATLIPEHLKGANPKEALGNCFLVVNQAVRWGMDPFAVAQETYAVRGKLGFQGKLIAAVINARAGLKHRLAYSFEGTGENRTITVSATFHNEDTPRTVQVSVKQAKTDNKLWTSDPDQKLIYTGATKWARRHCPEVILGVLTEDDLERIQESHGVETSVHLPPSKVKVSVLNETAEPIPSEPEIPESVSDAIAFFEDIDNLKDADTHYRKCMENYDTKYQAFIGEAYETAKRRLAPKGKTKQAELV